jgi:hypothetical protein
VTSIESGLVRYSFHNWSFHRTYKWHFGLRSFTLPYIFLELSLSAFAWLLLSLCTLFARAWFISSSLHAHALPQFLLSLVRWLPMRRSRLLRSIGRSGPRSWKNLKEANRLSFKQRPLQSWVLGHPLFFYLLLFHSMFISSLHNIKSKNFKK